MEVLFFLLITIPFVRSGNENCLAIAVKDRVGTGCEHYDATTCESNGCCWDYNYDNVTSPNQCGSDTTGGDCWGNGNENDCINYGCCWNDQSSSAWCYFGNITEGEKLPQCYRTLA